MKVIVIVGDREEYLQFEILKGLLRMGVEMVVSQPLNVIRDRLKIVNREKDVGADELPINQPLYSAEGSSYHTDAEIVEHSKDADYIFVLWNKFPTPTSTGPGGRMYLVDMINEPDKTVVIDGSEYSYSGFGSYRQWKDSKNYIKGSPWIWHHMRDRAKWYFKRETFIEDVHEHNIIPCPYPFRVEDRQEQFKNSNRDVDLTCIFGQVDTGLRSEVNNYCLNLRNKSQKQIHVGRVSPNLKYMELLCKSKMNVTAWGGGMNILQRVESMMNETAVIGQKWEILNPNDFTDGVNIINYEDVNEFAEKVDYYFKNQDKLIEIGENGYKHAIKYHTTEKRMEYIFDIISGKLKWEV